MDGRDGKGEIRAESICEMAYLILKRRKFCRAKKGKKKNNARILKNKQKNAPHSRPNYSQPGHGNEN